MVQLNFKKIGDGGNPLIILHGLFGMLDNWQTLGKKIADNGHTVYLLDQRDHGKSPFTNQFNYSILAQDLNHFMETHNLKKSSIMGHSMGGKTAMQFAFDFSEKIEKLIVVDIVNKRYRGGHEEIFQAMETLPIDTIESRDDIHLHFHRFNLDKAVILFLLKNLHRKKDSLGFEWKMNHINLHKNYNNILGTVGNKDSSFKANTLFVKGEKSEYIETNDFQEIKTQFPNSKMVMIKDAGHWVHADQPEVFANEIFHFLG